MSKYQKVKYMDMYNTLHTGDILLFRGKGFASRMIQIGTLSPWSHVGMVWEGSIYRKCWESTSMNKGQCGVQMTSLKDRLRNYNGRVFVRRLHITRDSEFYRRMNEYRGSIEGVMYEKNALELMGAAMPWRNMVDFTTLFCSEKEAGCFNHCRLFTQEYLEEKYKTANEYTPADFSSKRGDVDKRLRGGVWLEREIEFDLKAMR